ncbi:MAG TPA: PH domain-containing protein [Actinomycetota bacterium]|nr:PH domain-containing protein [Actinomycetota bacterium]
MPLSDKKREQMQKDAAPVLMPGEQVVDATSGLAEVRRFGQNTRRRATVLVTDRRVVIFSKKVGGYDVQDYAYGLLTGVDHKKGMAFGHLSLRASGDSADLSQVEKTDVERVSQLIRDRMALSHQPGQQPDRRQAIPPQAAGTSQGSVADELVKLARLRDQGILTEDEFVAQKAKLLG